MPNTQYRISSSYLVLHDKGELGRMRLSAQFDELYHLFLVKIARLPQEPALTKTQEERLVALFSRLNALKRQVERD